MVLNALGLLRLIGPGAILLLATSCESTDHRLVEFAQRSTEQQVRQNERLAEQSTAVVKQNHEVVAAAHELVEHDAAARRELLQAQEQWRQQTHVERSDLDHQRRLIDEDRTAARLESIQAPVIGQAIVTVGLALAALVPLLVTAYALRKLPEHSTSESLLTELLLHDLVTGLPDGAQANPNLAAKPNSRLSTSGGGMIESDLIV